MSVCLKDFHTHRLDSTDGIISVEPFFSAFQPGKLYSVGIHPWSSENASEELLDALSDACRRPDVVAIGECGLDRLRGGDLARQIEIFRRHIALSEELRKPLIVHSVRCTAELLAERRRSRATMPWGFHGFRGGPGQAAQLCGAGIWIGLGERFNTDAALVVPAGMLLAETDDSPVGIDAVAARIAEYNSGDTAANLGRFIAGI